jgi:catechol 2,3-dioxygenase-like lactoylglutathione lyase family enzyme
VEARRFSGSEMQVLMRCVAGCGMLKSMKLPILGVRQIKLPVGDLARSARWYTDLFGLELAAEFFEDSAVRGVVLADHAAGFVIGLRQREYCASVPVLKGFDVCAFAVTTPGEMLTVVARCVELGIAHDDIQDRGEFGIAMDVPDPDGTVLSFVAGPHTGPHGTFFGLEFGAGAPTRYDQPRLSF